MPRPDQSFETLPLPPPLQATLQQLGYQAMTPIQAASLPLAPDALNTLVLDEADRMLDMGFAEDIAQPEAVINVDISPDPAVHTHRVGRKEKIRPGDVLGALTKDIGLPGTQVGRIVVDDFSTCVAVARGVADKALRGLNAGKVKGRSVKVRRL